MHPSGVLQIFRVKATRIPLQLSLELQPPAARGRVEIAISDPEAGAGKRRAQESGGRFFALGPDSVSHESQVEEPPLKRQLLRSERREESSERRMGREKWTCTPPGARRSAKRN